MYFRFPSAKNSLSSIFAACFLFYSSFSSADCIGVVTAGGGADFWEKVGKGAKKAGSDQGYEVIVRGPMNEKDGKNQLAIIRQMLSSGCKGLVVAPNSRHSEERTEELFQGGIEAVFIDRNFNSQIISTVKTDNYSAGQKAAKYMQAALRPGSRVVLFRLDENVASTTAREAGFKDYLTEKGLIVLSDTYLGSDKTTASSIAFDTLKGLEPFDGVFTPNESTTLAVLNMRRRLRHGDQIKHIGFDSHPRIIEALENGEMVAVVAQDPLRMGYQAVETVIRLLKGGAVASRIETPSTLLTAESSVKNTPDASQSANLFLFELACIRTEN